PSTLVSSTPSLHDALPILYRRHLPGGGVRWRNQPARNHCLSVWYLAGAVEHGILYEWFHGQSTYLVVCSVDSDGAPARFVYSESPSLGRPLSCLIKVCVPCCQKMNSGALSFWRYCWWLCCL